MCVFLPWLSACAISNLLNHIFECMSFNYTEIRPRLGHFAFTLLYSTIVPALPCLPLQAAPVLHHPGAKLLSHTYLLLLSCCENDQYSSLWSFTGSVIAPLSSFLNSLIYY